MIQTHCVSKLVWPVTGYLHAYFCIKYSGEKKLVNNLVCSNSNRSMPEALTELSKEPKIISVLQMVPFGLD